MENLRSIAENPHSWVYIGFFIFVIAAGPKIWRALSAMLDQRALKIKADIDLAQKLRTEAEALLEEYKRKQTQANQEVAAILQSAKEVASVQSAEARQKLDQSLKRREKLSLEKIQQAESQALATIKSEAIDIATKAAEHLIRESLTQERCRHLIDQAVTHLPRHPTH